jgi:hypothetical protein
MWYSASASFGLFLFWFASEKELLKNPDTARFELAVLLIVWVAVSFFLRRFFRDARDPWNIGGK